MLLLLVCRSSSGAFRVIHGRHPRLRILTETAQLLGADTLIDASALAQFLGRCQYKFGGIAKGPEARPGEPGPSVHI